MSDAETSDWYAVSAWPARTADARADLVGLGLSHYVPCETVERRLGRKMQAVRRPVWPGYIFIHCAPSQFRAVLDVEGVYDFVRADRTPVVLAANALVPVLLAEMFGELDYTRKPAEWRPERGDRVRVKSGKWKGYLGRVLSLSKNKAIMELETWGKLTVDPGALEAAA